MDDAADVLETLARLGGDPVSGVYLQPAAGEESLRRMQEDAFRDLGEPVPEDYVALLRVTDGVQVNNAYFKSAGGLVPENLDVPRPDIIVLGIDGSTAEFVFDRRDRQFQTTNRGSRTSGSRRSARSPGCWPPCWRSKGCSDRGSGSSPLWYVTCIIGVCQVLDGVCEWIGVAILKRWLGKRSGQRGPANIISHPPPRCDP